MKTDKAVKERIAQAVMELTEHIDGVLGSLAEDLAEIDERFVDEIDTAERGFYAALAKYAAAKGKVK